MSARYVFPNVYDPHMHREEIISLARRASQQQQQQHNGNGINNVNGSPSQSTAMTRPADKPSQPAPRRRHFVFADPVAFRFVFIT